MTDADSRHPPRAAAPSSEPAPVSAQQLQQLHHSLRNGLQMISASLQWQSRQTNNEEVQLALRQAVDRLGSFARIHRRLQEMPGAMRFDGLPYLQLLLDDLRDALLRPGSAQSIRLLAPAEFVVESTQAAALGSLLTELLTNAVKHGDERHDVLVRVDDDGQLLTVQVENEGGGLSEADAALRSSAHGGGFGLQLVRSLCTRSGGRLTFEQIGRVTRVTASLGREQAP